MTDEPGGAARARMLTALALLWLAGVALRLTILAVPPVIPLIHDDLHLSATQVGILTGLPSMLFAIAAVPGSLLIARLGVRTAHDRRACAQRRRRRAARRAAGRRLALRHDHRHGRRRRDHAGDACRRRCAPGLPHRIGFATAVYTNGLLVGEILPVALMLPLVLPLVGSWQWGFAFWSVPVARHRRCWCWRWRRGRRGERRRGAPALVAGLERAV